MERPFPEKTKSTSSGTSTEKKSPESNTLLVIGLTKNGEIVQFNKKCEQKTGYSYTTIHHKQFLNVLIPKKYLDQWDQLLSLILADRQIDDFILPLQTRWKNQLPILWKGLLLKDDGGRVQRLCLLGEEATPQQLNQSFKTTSTIHDNPTSGPTAGKKGRENAESKVVVQMGGKRLMFRNHTRSEHLKPQNQPQASPVKEQRKKTEEPLSVSETGKMKDLLRKYSQVTVQLQELQKKDQKLEKKSRKLEQTLKKLEARQQTHLTTSVRQKNEPEPVVIPWENTNSSSASQKKYSFFQDPFGVKRERASVQQKIQAVVDRQKELDSLTEQVQKEREKLDSQIQQFCQAKEKLKLVEEEIERRYQELTTKEQMIQEQLTATPQLTTETPHESSQPQEHSKVDYHQMLDKIPQSAAIIQRGILKQVNDIFAQTIGYETTDLVEKNFLDFVAPEGLAEIEKYYLSRLKGDTSLSTYKTVVFSKDNLKIPVEVSIRSTVYDGEKAEIAVVTVLDH